MLVLRILSWIIYFKSTNSLASEKLNTPQLHLDSHNHVIFTQNYEAGENRLTPSFKDKDIKTQKTLSELGKNVLAIVLHCPRIQRKSEMKQPGPPL